MISVFKWFLFVYSPISNEGLVPLLRSGEDIEEAVNSLREYLSPVGPVTGLLFNCSSPEVITDAMPILRKSLSSLNADVRIGAYANGFLKIFDQKGEFLRVFIRVTINMVNIFAWLSLAKYVFIPLKGNQPKQMKNKNQSIVMILILKSISTSMQESGSTMTMQVL